MVQLDQADLPFEGELQSREGWPNHRVFSGG